MRFENSSGLGLQPKIVFLDRIYRIELTLCSLCTLTRYAYSFGVAFGNLSPFGRLWSITAEFGLSKPWQFPHQ